MENTSMNQLSGRYRWALALLVLALTVTAGGIAYNVGVSHGLAQVATAAGTTTPLPYAYGWHPWGFFPFFPLLFIVFWVVLFRSFWWGWGPRRPWHHSYGPYDRESFDEWHRRAHDQMKS
jgi:hypothetical protein